jgi:peptidyl-prolyl cis-trans isomerase B (cyclophilin B)
MRKIALAMLAAIFMINLSVYSQNKTDKKVVKFEIKTEYGTMKGILYNETPQHRDNFVKLTKQGFYDGLLFHRVISGFMIQGGDPDSKNAKAGQSLGMGGPGYTVPAEFNKSLIHKKGALAAARTADQMNPQKASSGSQFYIVQGKPVPASQLGAYTPDQKKIYETLGGVPFLDNNYTVYGEITEGLDVIDKIATVQKDGNDRPVKDVKMTVKIIE